MQPPRIGILEKKRWWSKAKDKRLGAGIRDITKGVLGTVAVTFLPSRRRGMTVPRLWQHIGVFGKNGVKLNIKQCLTCMSFCRYKCP